MSEEFYSENADVAELTTALEERQENGQDKRIIAAHNQFGELLCSTDSSALRAKRLADQYDRKHEEASTTYDRQNLGVYLQVLDYLDYIEEQEEWGHSRGAVYDVQMFDEDAYRTVTAGLASYRER